MRYYGRGKDLLGNGVTRAMPLAWILPLMSLSGKNEAKSRQASLGFSIHARNTSVLYVLPVNEYPNKPDGSTSLLLSPIPNK